MNDIALSILLTVHRCGEIRGMAVLAHMVGADRYWVRKIAMKLAARKLISIEQSNGGRGRCTIIKDAGALDQIDQEKA